MKGKETPDPMNLRHADMCLPDLLGRPSLRHAVRDLAMQETSLYYTAKVTYNSFHFY